MKKQYYLSQPSLLSCTVTLYHDGIEVDQVKKWLGNELDEYLCEIEALGYTQGYSQEEVDKAEAKFRHLQNNLIKGELTK